MAKKVLIVDDDASALAESENILKTAGFEVLVMNNPKFIFKVIKDEKPDVVVSDIIMPHQDGYALCQEIRKLYGDKIPVLLCTSQSYEQDFIQNAYKDFGADDYILKPVQPQELIKKVKALSGRKGNE